MEVQLCFNGLKEFGQDLGSCMLFRTLGTLDMKAEQERHLFLPWDCFWNKLADIWIAKVTPQLCS